MQCEPALTPARSSDVGMRATILAAMWQPLTAVSAMLWLNSIALLLSRRSKYQLINYVDVCCSTSQDSDPFKSKDNLFGSSETGELAFLNCGIFAEVIGQILFVSRRRLASQKIDLKGTTRPILSFHGLIIIVIKQFQITVEINCAITFATLW